MNHAVYEVPCKDCPSTYIGETNIKETLTMAMNSLNYINMSEILATLSALKMSMFYNSLKMHSHVDNSKRSIAKLGTNPLIVTLKYPLR